MLLQMQVNNFVTIQTCELNFKIGTTVITGETGTGKSILIDALQLALGGRASENCVRVDQEKMDVSLVFDIACLPQAIEWLKKYDLYQDENECIIRRSINKEGRSRCFINNSPTTLQPLRELSELLIDIHGQHEYQTLLKAERQRELVDNYAGHSVLLDSVFKLAYEWKTLNTTIANLKQQSATRTARAQYLQFLLEEFAELAIQPNEFAKLDLEHKQLANSEETIAHLTTALDQLADLEESNALATVAKTILCLDKIKNVNPAALTWIETLKSAQIQIAETEKDIRHYLEKLDLDPARLATLETRLSAMFNLARKHKISPNELYEFQQKLLAEFKELDCSDEKLTELERQLELVSSQYIKTAQQLSESRSKYAKKLSSEITKIIKTLALPHAEFSVGLENENTISYSPFGLEKISFLIKTNAGHQLQSLAKTASGGELSRIALAIYIITAKQQAIPALVFDEVDVGISGGTAEMVGKLLRQLGDSHQVFCVTHLPQVASLGHHHLKVEKITEKQMTYSTIKPLSQDEKVQEIARMLGGLQITKKTLEHAKEMVTALVD